MSAHQFRTASTWTAAAFLSTLLALAFGASPFGL
jgi:hypothetical protein